MRHVLKLAVSLVISLLAGYFMLAFAESADSRNKHWGEKMPHELSATSTLITRFDGWRLIKDAVMGGLSTGNLQPDKHQGRDCLRLRGSVSTANNGGFIQMALDLKQGEEMDVSRYTGIVIEIAGNGEEYNLHLRTSSLWMPWQSYRASFIAEPGWREVRIPFSSLHAYKTFKRFDPARLLRIGLVAIGREFEADLCFASLYFYQEPEDG